MLIWTQSTGFQLSWLSTLDLYEGVDIAGSTERAFLSATSFFQQNQFAFQQYQLKSNKYSGKAIRTKAVHYSFI